MVKKFLLGVMQFIGTGLICYMLLAVLSALLVRFFFSYKIPNHKNIIVLGDSLPTNAINDNIIKNAFNISHHSTSYFHSLLKTRRFIEQNPHIDTLVLGYHYFSFLPDRKEWFAGDTFLKRSLKNYFNLMTVEDYFAILQVNPLKVLYFTIPAIGENMNLIFNNSRPLTNIEIGGHFAFNRNTQEKDIPLKEINLTPLAKNEVKYIKKIYKYCLSKNLKIILLFPPITEKLAKKSLPQKEYYCEFAKEFLPEATLVNHSTMDIGKAGFVDLMHMSQTGSKYYSEYIQKYGFQSTLLCPADEGSFIDSFQNHLVE